MVYLNRLPSNTYQFSGLCGDHVGILDQHLERICKQGDGGKIYLQIVTHRLECTHTHTHTSARLIPRDNKPRAKLMEKLGRRRWQKRRQHCFECCSIYYIRCAGGKVCWAGKYYSAKRFLFSMRTQWKNI